MRKRIRERRSTRILGLAVLTLAGVLGSHSPPGGGGVPILEPRPDQLSLAGDVVVKIAVPLQADLATLVVTLDGVEVTDQLAVGFPHAEGVLGGVEAGPHLLSATVDTVFGPRDGVRSFETVELQNPDECEVLNNEECLLPYPSNRFREGNGSNAHLALPQIGVPKQLDGFNLHGGGILEIPASHFEKRDGFSPTQQILMHFPQNVDLEASGAARLLAEPNRTTDLRSLDPDSPTLLIDWRTGERILHWTENDAIAALRNPARQVLFLRPGRSLVPGRRYIVAVRNLVDPSGAPVVAEAPFAALRDRRRSTIDGVNSRRRHFEQLFRRLESHGVERDELTLAFDFTVASDHNLTGQMISMRDQAFDWLADQDQDVSPSFTVNAATTETFDCDLPGQAVWKKVRGTYRVPLFLDSDPEIEPLTQGRLMVGPDDFTPVWQTTTDVPFGISIPCAVYAPEADVHAIVIGHGLFGDGPETAIGLTEAIAEGAANLGIDSVAYIAGGTNWRGLSHLDIDDIDLGDPGSSRSYIVTEVTLYLPAIDSLPDRARQGVLNQLVLGRMMRQGLFNADPAFQTTQGGVFPDAEMYYFGASLGGVMGLMYSAVSPDFTRGNVDVPGVNFGMLLQRAKPFKIFETALDLTLIPQLDGMTQALGIGLIHELWATGEPAGYATHITENPLPGTNPKKILMTVAYLDQQVSNQVSEIAGRTLGLPSLLGSFQEGVPQTPDVGGPLESAYVVYDTGSYDLANPAHEPFIPPLANRPNEVDDNTCDPHGLRGTIPASLRQLFGFLRPGGVIENFCEGTCDADPTVVDTGPAGDFAVELPGGGVPLGGGMFGPCVP